MKTALDRFAVTLTLTLILVGQLTFAIFSPAYLKPTYQNRFFATTGIEFDGSDLHKLNEGAHYFGQTMIGWTKFPSFRGNLIESVGLPQDADINLHIQERQNIVFTITTNEPIEAGQLMGAKDYLQAQVDEYNSVNSTRFHLSNVDYQQITEQKTYLMGAIITLILSAVLSLALLFIRAEFFVNRKLRF